MKCCDLDCKSYFLFGMRIFFGAWLLYLGISKWIFMGPDALVGWITSEFDPPKTWVPHTLNVLTAWVILIAEPLLGALILSGKYCRQAWALTSILMFVLMFGQTLLMKYDIVAYNWHYVVLTLVCAAMCEPGKGCCGGEKKTGCCNS